MCVCVCARVCVCVCVCVCVKVITIESDQAPHGFHLYIYRARQVALLYGLAEPVGTREMSPVLPSYTDDSPVVLLIF
jgi:hypothetical protein